MGIYICIPGDSEGNPTFTMKSAKSPITQQKAKNYSKNTESHSPNIAVSVLFLFAEIKQSMCLYFVEERSENMEKDCLGSCTISEAPSLLCGRS